MKVLLSFSTSSVRLVGNPCRHVRHTSAPPVPVVSRLSVAPLTITDPSATNSPDLMISLTEARCIWLDSPLDSFPQIDISLERLACCSPPWYIYPTSVAFLFGTFSRHHCISTLYCKYVVRVSRLKSFRVGSSDKLAQIPLLGAI